MKDYKVRALRYFYDKTDNINRFINDEFFATKERYEFLKNKGAVELVEEQTKFDEKAEKTIDELVDEIVENKEVEKAIEEIADNMVEQIISKKKKRKK